jgi:hypothetical protein
MWRKERKWQPTNGQENCEITALPMDNGQHQVKNNYINVVTGIQVTSNETMTVVDTSMENIHGKVWYE